MSVAETAVSSKAGRLAAAIATLFGFGYCPLAPGTAGSAVALAVAMALARYAGWRPWQFAVLAALAAAPAIWAAGRLARQRSQKDPRVVVVDEALGQWLTIAGAGALNWKSWLAAFLLFRFFDIVKPAPARRSEALPGGWGIVADDAVAGLYGALVLFAAGCFNLY
ncbi:MAG: phosphatidylglycerophosphatase A [Acidobacteriota bacterium]